MTRAKVYPLAFYNPIKGAQMLEAMSCRGCKNEVKMSLDNHFFFVCDKLRTYGKRCEEFEVK